jgi:hypothetical protein
VSFGSQTGRTRSGTKGFSNKTKKLKRKKQEFHSHKRAHLQEAERLDTEQLRARTTLALERLGHQVLSTEPGGYDLQDWMRNLNSLLDDFQEKIGADRVTAEFREKRSAALVPLVQRPGPQDIDSEMEKLLREEATAKDLLADVAKKAAAKLATLKDEREACDKEIKLARDDLAELREAKQSRKFFSRLTGGGPSTDEAEARLAQLLSKQARLDAEIEGHRRARSGLVGKAPDEGDSASVETQVRLEAIQKRLGELQTARQEILQLSHEREAATNAISEMISTMDLGPPVSDTDSREE